MKKVICLIFLAIIMLQTYLCIANTNTILYPAEIVCSSYLSENDLILRGNYHPYYLIDNNPNTAWVEGSSGDGIDQFVVMYLQLQREKNYLLSIKNGYQKTNDLFYKNNRVKEIEVVFRTGTINNSKNISELYTLEDKMGTQSFEISPSEDCWAVKIIIKSVYKGTKYQDTCISDIYFTTQNNYVDSIQENNQRKYFEKWFDERKKKAIFFANLPTDYPYKAYKKKVYTADLSTTEWSKYDEGIFCKKLYLSYFKDTELCRFITSSVGEKYLVMLEKSYREKTLGNVKYNGREFYLPQILSDWVFKGMEKFLSLSKLQIDSKTTGLSGKKYIGLFSGEKLHGITEIIPHQEERDTINTYIYDDSGRLIFIKGDYDGEGGDYCDDVIIAWDKNKIFQLFRIYAGYLNVGVQVEVTVFH